MDLIKVYDFFSGCGGASCGFRNAGMEIALGIDNDPEAATTFQRNFPEANFLCKDIRYINVEELEDYIDRESPSLFCGCAPCQPFSRQNRNKSEKDDRVNLLGEFGRFVEHYLPDYIFVENVPGIQNFPIAESPLASFCDLLKRLEYREPSFKVVEALRYGVPQKRKRLILIVGRQRDLEFPAYTYKNGNDNLPTVGDWIGDLPPLMAGETSPDDPEHCAAKLSELNLRRIRATPEGGNRRDWPEELWLNCHKIHDGHTDVYGRLSFDRPASALTTRCISYSNGRFGHPVQDRAISIREAANLQTFPRNYRFYGNLGSKAKQIGNAVPPLMAETFGRVFIAGEPNAD